MEASAEHDQWCTMRLCIHLDMTNAIDQTTNPPCEHVICPGKGSKTMFMDFFLRDEKGPVAVKKIIRQVWGRRHVVCGLWRSWIIQLLWACDHLSDWPIKRSSHRGTRLDVKSVFSSSVSRCVSTVQRDVKCSRRSCQLIEPALFGGWLTRLLVLQWQLTNLQCTLER